jgi:hypothetical protein
MALRNQIAPEMLSSLTSAQLANIDIIENEFAMAGLPVEFAAGAIANAWHESKLKAKAEGDHTSASRYTSKYSLAELEDRCTYSNTSHPCPQSIGLFQLKSPTGAGGTMSAEDRADPRLNTRRMIEQVNKKYGDQMRADYASGNRSVSHFAALFCRDIERPANKQGCWDKRAVTAKKFFPSDRVTPRAIWPWLVGIGAVLAIGAGIWYWKWK